MEPEEKKMVKISVWDTETDEIIEMEINQEDLDAMDAADLEQEKRMEKSLREEVEKFSYLKDDD